MQGIKILLVSVLLTFTQGTSASQFLNWQSSWIEGGAVAANGEFPYLVSVRTSQEDNLVCGGSIISEWYILTAAQCVIGFPASSITVVVGTNTLNAGGKKHEVSSIFTHQHFRIDGGLKDIGLLRLKEPVVYSQTVQPIKLPNQDEIVNLRKVCNFGGWGITSENGPFSNSLLKVQIKIVRSTQCKQFNSFFDDTKLCALAPPRKGLCRGDAGGPLVCGGKQVGILTGGGTPNTLCKTGYPLDFVYVSKYINWIKEIMM